LPKAHKSDADQQELIRAVFITHTRSAATSQHLCSRSPVVCLMFVALVAHGRQTSEQVGTNTKKQKLGGKFRCVNYILTNNVRIDVASAGCWILRTAGTTEMFALLWFATRNGRATQPTSSNRCKAITERQATCKLHAMLIVLHNFQIHCFCSSKSSDGLDASAGR
jgi:hypothetical protein